MTGAQQVSRRKFLAALGGLAAIAAGRPVKPPPKNITIYPGSTTFPSSMTFPQKG